MKTPKKTGDARIDAAITDTVRDLPRVVSCGRIDFLAANVEVAIPHKLGEVPDKFSAFPWSALTVYAPEDSQRKWTKDSIALMSSAIGTATVFVEKL